MEGETSTQQATRLSWPMERAVLYAKDSAHASAHGRLHYSWVHVNCTLYRLSDLDAVDRYTAGLRVCPLSCPKERAVLYANRGQMKRVLGLNDQEL